MSRNRDEDLKREIEAHLELEAEERVADGLTPEEARFAARRAFGNVTRVREDARSVWKAPWFDHLLHDLRNAVRTVRRAPAFTCGVALSMGLALGGAVGILNVVDALLLRPLPYTDASRLFVVEGVFTRLPLHVTEAGLELTEPLRAPELSDTRSFEALGAFSRTGMNLSGDRSERVTAAAVTPAFFTALAVSPRLGRVFQDRDITEVGRIAVIGFRLWQRHFHSAPDVVGRTVVLNGRPFVISGVLDDGITFPEGAEVWIPSASDPQLALQPAVPRFVGRLRPGVTPGDARRELGQLLVAGGVTKQESGNPSLRIIPLRVAMVGQLRPALLLVSASALLVLVVACLNASNLWLAHLTARRREFAVRRAIGSTFWRLLRQLVGESVVMAGLAAAIALPIVLWTTTGIAQLLPRLASVPSPALDLRSFATLTLLSIASGIVVGLFPAVTVALPASVSVRLGSSSTESPAGRWLRSGLVVAQIAVALAIVVTAAALVRTVREVLAVDIGARHQNALVLEVMLPGATYTSSDRMAGFYESVLAELRRLPGVIDAGATNHIPGATNVITPSMPVRVDGNIIQPGPHGQSALRLSATPGYFAAAGIDLVAGRSFLDSDRRGTPRVAMVSESYARAFGLEPAAMVGRRIRSGMAEDRWGTVIGVVRDVKMRGPESELLPASYVPFAQIRPNATGFIVVHPRTADPLLIQTLHSAVRRIDASIPLFNISTLSGLQAQYVSTRDIAMMATAAFAALAIGLAVVGLYAVSDYIVRLTTRQIGIRMALGATPAVVQREVLTASLLRAVVGVAGGFLLVSLSWPVTARYIAGAQMASVEILGAITAVVLMLCAAAAWVPARRAAHVDPLFALRND